MLKTAGAEPLENELPVPAAHEAFEGDGRLRQPILEAALAEIVRALIDLPSQRPHDKKGQ